MRSKSPWGVRGLGAGRAKWCSVVGEGASFEKACSRLRQSMFFTSHVCQRFFQGAAAAAAGRGSPPPPGAGVRQTVVIQVQEHDGKEQEEQGGWCGHIFQPPPPPGPLLRYLSSEMGGPGAGGRTCEIMLWCRRGRILSKIMLSLAPEHDFHTSCAQSRQGRSGASGPGV